MSQTPDETLADVRRTLSNWHATHPTATFAEMEDAVEAQLHHLRARLLAEQVDETIVREQPTCHECGATMTPRTQTTRQVVLGGDETVDLDRAYSVCPTCGSGLFPPG